MPNNAKTIYMDYQSTTPVDPAVMEEMLPFFCSKFGNPHSLDHSYGIEAYEAVQLARQRVADLINADPREIIFTSGATESNNIALKGAASFYGQDKNHIITCVTEHKCVLATCKYLESIGFKVTYLPVKHNGIIDMQSVKDAITDKTLMISIMAVNNEIGVIQPLQEIGDICKEHDILFHTDAAQGFGKIPIDVQKQNISLMSISGHKIYGPKGVGALYIRRKPKVRLAPLFHGGGQERGIRSGTTPTPLVVGLGKAAEIASKNMAVEESMLRDLFNRFYDKIFSNLTDVVLNGDREQRYPGNINMSFSCIEGESMMGGMPYVAVSSGSACASESLESSYVLKAVGIKDDMAHASVRFGIGRFTTKEEIDAVADMVIGITNKLRALSPLWEMKQEGIDLNQVEWSEH